MYNLILLDVDLLQNKNKNLTAVLEEIDPSCMYSECQLKYLDAFERQLYRYNLTATEPINKFFQSTETLVLFTEFIRCTLKQVTGQEIDFHKINIAQLKDIIKENKKVMETISTKEKIERLEKELAGLREQERLEKKVAEERSKDLSDISNSIAKFNRKYSDNYFLARTLQIKERQ